MAVSAPEPQEFPRPRGQVPCSYHPDVMTGLRCSRCGKPICPRCGVRTPVGLRCPDCAGVRGLPTYQTSTNALLKAGGVGLVVAVAVAVLWRFWPEWQFYLCLLLGFGVAESMAWAANYKRGRDLQALGVGMVVVGLTLSRYLLARHYGITAEQVNAYGEIVAELLQMRVIPDLLFAAIAVAIPWIRFR
jgi:hypothetical protein